MLPSENRLKKNYQFGYIYKNGRGVPGRNMTLTYTAARGNAVKIGFSVSNKIGKATTRNRVRRRMREAARKALPELRRGIHCVFTARQGITESDYAAVERDIRYLLSKAGLLSPAAVSAEGGAVRAETGRARDFGRAGSGAGAADGNGTPVRTGGAVSAGNDPRKFTILKK